MLQLGLFYAIGSVLSHCRAVVIAVSIMALHFVKVFETSTCTSCTLVAVAPMAYSHKFKGRKDENVRSIRLICC